jgi:cytochrome c oxidase cbb3-type subunit III
MSARSAISGVLLAACSLAACDMRPYAQPAAGTPPADLEPTAAHLIGPMPGPGEHPPSPPNPYAEDARAAGEGRRLFVQFNCAGCHGTHAGGGMGPSLRDAAWIYGSEPRDVYDSVAAGRAHGMPAFSKLLPAEGIWKLVAYIETLETSDEPQPPQ